jgi:flagellar basal body-associated protein FliL
MAEEQPDQTGRKGLSPLIILGVVVLGGAVLALALAYFVLLPRLAGPDEETPKALGAFFVQFPNVQLTGLADSRDELPPILQTDITLACDSAETAALVESGRPYFEGLLVELYSSKTRTQLSDPFERDLIRAEAVRKSNALLNEVAPGGKGEVVRVIHNRYILVEQ